MTLTRSFLYAAVCALSITACGSDDKKTSDPDIDGGQVTPQGDHYQYVVDQASVPTSNDQVDQFGLDIGGSTSASLDQQSDNQLGLALSSLVALAHFPIQETITQAVDQGKIMLLVDLQTSSLNNASDAGFTVKLGGSSTPTACTDAADTQCRHQFDGSAAFTVAADSPAASTVTGTIAAGTLKAGPGALTLQIALGSTEPITLNLVNARVQATEITQTGMTALIGGAVLSGDLSAKILPAVQAQLPPLLARDCGHTGANVDRCGCDAGSTGALLITALDVITKDCMVDLNEVQNNGLVSGLLQPDVCTTSSCTKADGVSIGIKVHAVKAKF